MVGQQAASSAAESGMISRLAENDHSSLRQLDGREKQACHEMNWMDEEKNRTTFWESRQEPTGDRMRVVCIKGAVRPRSWPPLPTEPAHRS